MLFFPCSNTFYLVYLESFNYDSFILESFYYIYLGSILALDDTGLNSSFSEHESILFFCFCLLKLNMPPDLV